jgi:hypothetical protein
MAIFFSNIYQEKSLGTAQPLLPNQLNQRNRIFSFFENPRYRPRIYSQFPENTKYFLLTYTGISSGLGADTLPIKGLCLERLKTSVDPDQLLSD